MKSKKANWMIGFVAVASCAAIALTAGHALAAGPRGSGPIIYVTGQELFYDSIVGPDLPPHGPFQLLEMGGPTGLQTQYGPGDPGYVGGRWWVDVNGNGEMDADDDYFSCPLLGPGRDEP